MPITVHVQQILRAIRGVCASRVFASPCKEGPFESTRFFELARLDLLRKKASSDVIINCLITAGSLPAEERDQNWEVLS